MIGPNLNERGTTVAVVAIIITRTDKTKAGVKQI